VLLTLLQQAIIPELLVLEEDSLGHALAVLLIWYRLIVALNGGADGVENRCNED
jgi:hypothetical protein